MSCYIILNIHVEHFLLNCVFKLCYDYFVYMTLGSCQSNKSYLSLNLKSQIFLPNIIKGTSESRVVDYIYVEGLFSSHFRGTRTYLYPNYVSIPIAMAAAMVRLGVGPCQVWFEEHSFIGQTPARLGVRSIAPFAKSI